LELWKNILQMKQFNWLNLLLNSIFIFTAISSCSQKHFRSTNYTYQSPKKMDDGLLTDNLVNLGIDTGQIVQLTKLILADSFPNIHSLLIAKDNKLVYENYFEGKDENWGSSLGYAKHDTSILHDTRSISKSVVAACIDIAIQQQKIKSIDEPIFNYLPEYSKYKTAQNQNITIKHLLTMSSGIEWDENVPHGTSANSETQMERSINPVEYVLSRPMDTMPGKVWKYNSGGVQVLAEIIRTVSGENIDLFAAKNLFALLGIRDYKWTYSSNIAIWFHLNKIFSKRRKFPAAASGLRLTSRDLLKFGLLFLNNGKWNDKQILSEEWVAETLKTKILRDTVTSATNGYSYLFWTHTDTVNNKQFELITARGNGGQRIFINKVSNLIVVITAGNYNKSGIKNDGQVALDKYILSALH
jgi:CubicO group peptidase (beta-lactamase class C family)